MYAQQQNIKYFETSAKSNIGVEEMFTEITRQALHQKVQSSAPASEPIKLNNQQQKQKPLAKAVVCRDGFGMSVQASRTHYCTPRDDEGPYEGVEVAYPSEWEDLLIPYTDPGTPTICGMAPTMYVNVPKQTIDAIVHKHGGLTIDSGPLPPMVQAGQCGTGAAAATAVTAPE